MSINEWSNAKVKKMDWVDLALVKLAVLFFTLALAKLWPDVLGLEWYWYGLVFILLSIKPLIRIWGR